MRRLCLAVVVLAAGCDPKAHTAAAGAPAAPAAAPAPGAAPAPAPAAAVPADTSRLGEFHWMAGLVALEKGKRPEALESFQKALARFEEEKKDPPAGLLCDTGAALRPKADGAEPAARLLHRCLLASPPGTAEHLRALRELVALEPFGLDPALLAKETLADTYLTRPLRVSAETLRVDVVRSTATATDKGYEGWAKVLEGPPARAALFPCFETYAQASRKTQLVLNLPVKLKARLGDDDLYVGGVLDQQADPAATGPEAAAQQCARAALVPLAQEFARSGSNGSWTGAYALTLSFGP